MNQYADFLGNERGLAERSIQCYLPFVSKFLNFLEGENPKVLLEGLDAHIVRGFLLSHSDGRSCEYVRLLAITLRSFLRYLNVLGIVPTNLTGAIPSFRKWSQANVPRKLTRDEVTRVLNAPDRSCPRGRRDYAILLLLAKLGLRSSEIISLKLDDLRWRSGEIVIRGKGNRMDPLPLPHDVGAAIAKYLKLDPLPVGQI